MLTRTETSLTVRKYVAVNRLTLWAADRMAQNRTANKMLDSIGGFLTTNHGIKVDKLRSFIRLMTLNLEMNTKQTTIRLFPTYATGGLRQMADLGLTPERARMRHEALILLRSGKITEFNDRFRRRTRLLNLKNVDLAHLCLTEKIPLMDLNRIAPTGLNLRGANLEGADLSGSILNNAILRGANLKGANLRGTWLRGAVLTGAKLEGADMTDAQGQLWL